MQSLALAAASLLSPFFLEVTPEVRSSYVSLGKLVEDRPMQITNVRAGYDAGDFSTPERKVPEGGRFTRRTEACQSVGVQSWGYRRDEDYFTPRYLLYSIDRTMTMGGSYLLNVGPTAEGRIPPES